MNRLPTVAGRRLDKGKGLVRMPQSGLVRMYYEATVRSFVMRKQGVDSLGERARLVQETRAAAQARKRSFGEIVGAWPQEVANSPILKFQKRRVDAPADGLQRIQG